jgi:hypothetical protein
VKSPFLWAKIPLCLSGPVKVEPLRGFAKNLQTSLRSARIFRKNLDNPCIAVLFARKREFPCFPIYSFLNNNVMQTFIFKKAALTVFLITLLTFCFCILSKAGIQPLLAAIALVCLKGFIRFAYRLTVMLVSIAIVIALIIFLICI